MPGTPCLQDTHRLGSTSGCSTTRAPSLPPSFCLLLPPPHPVVHPRPTLLLAVPSPGAGLGGPVSPVTLCCSPRGELGDLGASPGPLPTSAGWIWPPACPPHFPGPGHRGVGFMPSRALFAVEPPWPAGAWSALPVTPCNWDLGSQEPPELFLSSGNS